VGSEQHGQHQQDRDRHRTHRRLADPQVRPFGLDDGLAIGEDQGGAPHDRHRRQRRDEGRDPPPGDQGAVQEADQAADHGAGEHARDVPGGAGDEEGGAACQGDGGAHRQVNPAGDDHHRHATATMALMETCRATLMRFEVVRNRSDSKLRTVPIRTSPMSDP
jgi:hypothetical protein